MTAEKWKPRLQRLSPVLIRSPIYFVTACTHKRRLLLANDAVHKSFVGFGEKGPEHGAWIGDYVLMPDHLHLFVLTDDNRLTLAAWGKSLKKPFQKPFEKLVLMRRTGRKPSSIMYSEATNLIPRNGSTFEIILSVPDW